MEVLPLVSIIVPVYNTVEYLNDCFHSICTQTYSNLEIIAVDDGSTDGSSELLDRIAEVDYRIKVVHQSNLGVSVARNKGLSLANGAYIAFCDSDDIIGRENIEFLVRAAIESDANFCISNTVISIPDIYTERDIVTSYRCIPFVVHKYTSAILKISNSVWGNLYSTQIIRNKHISFDYKLHNKEDGLFNIVYQIYATKCVIVDGPVVYYRQREGSITTRCVDLVWESESIYNALSSLRHESFNNLTQNKFVFLNRRVWVNGYFDTFCRMSRSQRQKVDKLDWNQTKYPYKMLLKSSLSIGEKIKELFLCFPLVENRTIYPVLIYFRRVLNDKRNSASL